MIRLTNNMARSLLDVLEAALPAIREAQVAEVRGVLNEQLNATHHFDDLIDTVVKVLGDPHITSLNKDQLALLRKGLLSPLELAKFNSMRSKKQDCTRCERELSNYEAVTLSGGKIYCHQCLHPEVVTCVTCNQLIEVGGIQRTVTRALQRHTCTTT